MHRPAFLLVLSIPLLAAACRSDVRDVQPQPATDDLGLHHGSPPGLPHNPVQDWIDSHHGGCAQACTLVLVPGGCRLDGATLQDACEADDGEDGDPDFVSCGGINLTCAAAYAAAHSGAAGLQWCWESCGGLLGH